ncbi:hypothetical protein B0H16DRAFT_1733863 [Mycena metata]|uniref:Glycosyltransferase 2-like domain-containing protein n=1 Tax=Mycena metata TaxID=1033252 RepID=A0AAD7MSQ4_9AGAR|nr:hypothetical protein B0H16DRAFT_1733863 [Mycena metata]
MVRVQRVKQLETHSRGDLALRLLMGRYTLRWATYSEDGFTEGVSLTVPDELARWQKCAYGYDKIILNPLVQWWEEWAHQPATAARLVDCPELDRFYLKSFKILLACTVVFPGLGNLGFTLLEYRLGHRNFFSALLENLRWVPFLYAFSAPSCLSYSRRPAAYSSAIYPHQ